MQQVACPGCGCVCDDLRVVWEGEELKSVQPSCELADAWFRRHWSEESPPTLIEGAPASLESAIDRAVEILDEADYPLIYGLSRGVTSGQRAAVALGECVGGVVDTTASLCHGPSILALQEVGEVTSTLGEIRNRADLVIFWGCNPASSHPRHAERYSVSATGRFTPKGRSDRVIVMVGDADRVESWRLDPEGSEPDLVIPVTPGSDFETLSCLHAMLPGTWRGPVRWELERLMDLMKGCRYGVVFFGLGLAKTSMWESGRNSQTGQHDVAALLKLVSDLNAFTRFTARRMRLQGDVSGADNVLLWQTGYPYGVDFSRGYPRYNPGEFTANDLLERGDVDACLLMGAETTCYLSEAARDHLRSIPTILIDYPNAVPPHGVSVQMTTAVHGIHAGGTIYRMDNVPISLRPLRPSGLPTDEHVLTEIRKRYDARQGDDDFAARSLMQGGG
jgi:formylmethanofuran dehydrogenase subunit B